MRKRYSWIVLGDGARKEPRGGVHPVLDRGGRVAGFTFVDPPERVEWFAPVTTVIAVGRLIDGEDER